MINECESYYLYKWDYLDKNEPDVNHLKSETLSKNPHQKTDQLFSFELMK